MEVFTSQLSSENESQGYHRGTGTASGFRSDIIPLVRSNGSAAASVYISSTEYVREAIRTKWYAKDRHDNQTFTKFTECRGMWRFR